MTSVQRDVEDALCLPGAGQELTLKHLDLGHVLRELVEVINVECVSAKQEESDRNLEKVLETCKVEWGKRGGEESN
jgi:hypothetical protein